MGRLLGGSRCLISFQKRPCGKPCGSCGWVGFRSPCLCVPGPRARGCCAFEAAGGEYGWRVAPTFLRFKPGDRVGCTQRHRKAQPVLACRLQELQEGFAHRPPMLLPSLPFMHVPVLIGGRARKSGSGAKRASPPGQQSLPSASRWWVLRIGREDEAPGCCRSPSNCKPPTRASTNTSNAESIASRDADVVQQQQHQRALNGASWLKP
jgi:hypothetical protein